MAEPPRRFPPLWRADKITPMSTADRAPEPEARHRKRSGHRGDCDAQGSRIADRQVRLPPGRGRRRRAGPRRRRAGRVEAAVAAVDAQPRDRRRRAMSEKVKTGLRVSLPYVSLRHERTWVRQCPHCTGSCSVALSLPRGAPVPAEPPLGADFIPREAGTGQDTGIKTLIQCVDRLACSRSPA
jgi:hypothetical protein